MIINSIGAKEYWSKNIWFPPKYENENNEIEQLVELAHKHISEVINPSILELCCGQGGFSVQLLKRLDNYSEYQFLDTNENSLELLSQRLIDEGLFNDKMKIFNYYVGLNNLNQKLESRSDIVICARAITHIPDIPKYFLEVSDQLNVGGLFIADIVPSSERMPLLKEKHGIKSYIFEGAYHFGKLLASNGIGNKQLTKFGLLRTINPTIEEIDQYVNNSGLKLIDKELDSSNHYYRFVAKKY